MTRVGIVAAVIIIIAASVFFGFRKASRSAAKETESKVAAGSAPVRPHAAVGTPLEEVRPLRKIDPASRKLLLAHIGEARAKRVAAGASSSSTGSGSAAPGLPSQELSADYVLTQLGGIRPLLMECYRTALDNNPALAGTLSVSFTIAGEPDVGGVIEESEIDQVNSTITDPSMIECVRETMYALELVAPSDGGRHEFKTSFELTPEPTGSSAR